MIFVLSRLWRTQLFRKRRSITFGGTYVSEICGVGSFRVNLASMESYEFKIIFKNRTEGGYLLIKRLVAYKGQNP